MARKKKQDGEDRELTQEKIGVSEKKQNIENYTFHWRHLYSGKRSEKRR